MIRCLICTLVNSTVKLQVKYCMKLDHAQIVLISKESFTRFNCLFISPSEHELKKVTVDRGKFIENADVGYNNDSMLFIYLIITQYDKNISCVSYYKYILNNNCQ